MTETGPLQGLYSTISSHYISSEVFQSLKPFPRNRLSRFPIFLCVNQSFFSVLIVQEHLNLPHFLLELQSDSEWLVWQPFVLVTQFIALFELMCLGSSLSEKCHFGCFFVLKVIQK